MNDDQRNNLFKAMISIEKSIELYKEVGTDDYKEIATKLVECMKQMSEKLDIDDQFRFAVWLQEKTEAMKSKVS